MDNFPLLRMNTKFRRVLLAILFAGLVAIRAQSSVDTDATATHGATEATDGTQLLESEPATTNATNNATASDSKKYDTPEAYEAGWRDVVAGHPEDYTAMFWLGYAILDRDAKGANISGHEDQCGVPSAKEGSSSAMDRMTEAGEWFKKSASLAPPSAIKADALRRLGKIMVTQSRPKEGEEALAEASRLVREYGSVELYNLTAASSLSEDMRSLGMGWELAELATFFGQQACGSNVQIFFQALGLISDEKGDVRIDRSAWAEEAEACALRFDMLRSLGPAAEFGGNAGSCGWVSVEMWQNISGSPVEGGFYFALYRFRNGRKDHAAAWRALVTANEILGKDATYDSTNSLGDLNDLSILFPTRNVSIGERTPPLHPTLTFENNRTLTPVFVLGLPRSGTTLLEQILSSHSDAWGAGENSPLAAAAMGVLAEIAEWGEVDPEKLQDLGNRYLEAMAKRAPPGSEGKQWVVDKGLGNVWHLGYIHMVLPKACIIHAVRHPAAVALSSYEQNFIPTAIPWSFNLENMAHHINAHHEVMNHWVKALPGSVLTVHYSDMIRDQEGTVRRVLEFCDMPWDPKVLSFYETPRAVYTASQLQVRRPVYSASLDKWHTYMEGLFPLLRLLRTVIEKYEEAAAIPSSAGVLARLTSAARARGWALKEEWTAQYSPSEIAKVRPPLKKPSYDALS